MSGVFNRSRLVAAALLTIGLAGCANDLASNPPPSSAALVALADRTAAEARHATRPKAVITLPTAAGRVVAIDETDGASGFRQVIHLKSGRPGVDSTLALLTGADPRLALDATLAQKPSEATIKAELAAEFPTAAMAVWTKPLANAYGPYGLAVSMADDATTCAYAWQWIEDKSLLARRGLSGPVAWRAKLCRPGHAIADFTAWLDQIVIGRDIAAVASIEPGGAAPAAKPKARPQSHRAKRTETKRATPARDASAGPTLDDPMPSGPRYMAPISQSAFETTPSGLAPSGGAGSTTAALSTDLPPQATRGPAPDAGRAP
jgi:hypothetical protein